MGFERRTLEITSDDSGGGGSGVTKPIYGKIVKCSTLLSTSNATDNWDLTLTTQIFGASSTIFTDANRSNSTTVPDVSYPVAPCNKAADNGASAITEIPPVVHDIVTATVAGIGNTKTVKVELLIELD